MTTNAKENLQTFFWIGLIVSILVLYVILLGSDMKDAQYKDCLFSAVKAKGEPPSKEMMQWCKDRPIY